MAKKRISKDKDPFSIASIFGDIREQVKVDADEPYVPDIIEFCYSRRYLNFRSLGIALFPIQQIILKCFYRGQPGNEHIQLTKEEMDLLTEYGLENILEKYYSGELFRELVLVLGRRSGKDFLTSVIALYETMKLLEVPSGCPFKHYRLAPGNPIYILTVATSSDQAKILFREIKEKMQLSSYFKEKIGDFEQDRIYLLTPEDQKRNKDLRDADLNSAQTKGSVVIMSGHSNSEGLLGKRIWCLLLDEVASFKSTGGSSSGDRIYSALGPATVDFVRRTGKLDEKGEEITVTESKIVSISSPRAEEGVLFKLYNDAPGTDNRLAFKLPTWRVNITLSEDKLRKENKYMNPNEFNMEFGAQFSGTAGQKYIADKYVDLAMKMGTELNLDTTNLAMGIPGVVYYAHLDPASSSHNYALVILHVEERIRYKSSKDGDKTTRRKEKFQLFVIDHIQVWQPEPGKAVNVFEVDQYIIDIARRYRLGMVTYDAWNSLASIQRLRGKGIPVKMTPFRKQYKMAIYDRLEHLLVNNQVALPNKGRWSHLMEHELKCLKKIFKPQGFQIKPDPDGLVTTDDVCDGIAGALGQATERVYAGYPKGGTVYMPQGGTNHNFKWNIGAGNYSNQQYKFISEKLGLK